jgi:hypothetical protein
MLIIVCLQVMPLVHPSFISIDCFPGSISRPLARIMYCSDSLMRYLEYLARENDTDAQVMGMSRPVSFI